jgi:hypothetical protein
MRKFGSLLLCLVLFAGAKLSAQITITQTDVQNFINLGNTLDATIDSSTTSLDIGSPGSTSWDFSGISPDYQSTYTSISPSGTPFAGRFPSATACFNGMTNIMGYELNSWQYFGINNNALLSYGNAGQGSISGFTITALIAYNPAYKQIVIPLTMGDSWTQDYAETDSTVIAPLPPIISVYNYHEENTVDAYGTMTLPGGGTAQALRIRTHQVENDGGTITNYVYYLFLTKTGTQVLVDAADTTSPSSGTIPINGITYLHSNVVGVKQANNSLPENFRLEQNYPNPFNPTTQINYSIPSSQKVVLKVYDELGRDVATLVNNEQAAGNYTVDFDASNLASGIYFYRLQAGDFVQMKKMILMK